MASRKPETRGQRNARWIEDNLYYPDGPKVGKRVKLAKFQHDIITSIYDNPKALTRTAIISMGRKNAKSFIAACILLLTLCGPEAIRNGQLYSAANSRDQAALIFQAAMKMALMSPTIRPFLKFTETKKQIFCPEIGSTYKALSKDGSTAQGLNPQLVIFDEIGQQHGPTSPLFEALATASAAQLDPLMILISTQAARDGDLFSLLIDDALTKADPSTVIKMWSCPPEIDPWTEEALKLANPAWDEWLNKGELRKMQAAAKRIPSRAAEFKNLILNMRVDVETPFISREIWEECSAPPEPYQGKDVIIGLDLSVTTDLTSMAIMHQNDDAESYSVHSINYLPDEGLMDRVVNDKTPYGIWRDMGILTTTPGRIVDYSFVAAKLFQLRDEVKSMRVVFDPYNITHFKRALLEAGFTEQWIEQNFIKMRQGFISFSPAVRKVEELILKGKLRHGNNPLLNWAMSNVRIATDAAGNRKMVKSVSSRRIDPAITLAMAAYAISDAQPEQAKSYLDTMPMLVL